jgi:hypothetical protein
MEFPLVMHLIRYIRAIRGFDGIVAAGLSTVVDIAPKGLCPVISCQKTAGD